MVADGKARRVRFRVPAQAAAAQAPEVLATNHEAPRVPEWLVIPGDPFSGEMRFAG